jgi:hypothetical protein
MGSLIGLRRAFALSRMFALALKVAAWACWALKSRYETATESLECPMTERGVVDAMSFEQSRSDSDLMQGAVAHGAAGMRGGLRQGPMCAGRINTPGLVSQSNNRDQTNSDLDGLI